MLLQSIIKSIDYKPNIAAPTDIHLQSLGPEPVTYMIRVTMCVIKLKTLR